MISLRKPISLLSQITFNSPIFPPLFYLYYIRQGTLEMLRSDLIDTKFGDSFIQQLEEAGKSVMAATSKFGPTYMNKVSRTIHYISFPVVSLSHYHRSILFV